MLPYHTYFETLAALGDSNHPDWSHTVAGLAILRLIDDWLDTAEGHMSTPNGATRQSVAALLDHVPPIEPLKPILKSILDGLSVAEQSELEVVAVPLLTYAQQLHNTGHHTLAHDALAPLLRRALKAQKTDIAVQVALKLAMITRLAGDYALAEEYYDTASLHAHARNDNRSRWIATTGIGKILITYGEIAKAESLYADLENEVLNAGDFQTMRIVFHDQALIASLYHDHHRVIDLIRKAIACSEPRFIDDKEATEIDLALGLLEIGHLEESRRINLRASTLANDYLQRRRAMLILLRIAMLEGDFQAFNLYRSALALTSLPPLIEIQYRGEVAKGLRFFGQDMEAEIELCKAREIAMKSQVHTMFVE